MKKITFLIACLLFITKLFSQVPIWQWGMSIYNEPSNEMSSGNITTDKAGNIIYGGEVHGSLVKFDTISLSGTAPYYYIGGVVPKFSSTGKVKWVKTVSLYSGVVAVATDAFGNIYIAGDFTSNTYIGGFYLANQGNYDLFIAKLDPNGNFLWAKGMGGNGEDDVRAFSVDSAGNCVIGGHFYSNSLNFGGGVTLGGGVSEAAYVAKFDANGNVLWANYVDNSSYSEEITGVNLDRSGNVAVVGWTNGAAAVNYGSGVLNCTNGSRYFIKYNSAGTVMWAKSTSGASSVTSDSKGNFYIAGTFGGVSANFGSVILNNPSINLPNGFNYSNFFLVKYSPAGNAIWGKTNDIYSDGGVNVVSKDKYDNLLISGSFNSPGFSVQGVSYSASGAANKYYILKYDTAGNFYWIRGGTSSNVSSIAPDSSNNYIVGGTFNDTTKIIAADTLHNYYGNTTMFISMLPPCAGPYANAGLDTAVCLNDGIMLHAWGGQTYNWSPSTGLNNTNIPDPIANPTVTTLYTVSVTNECGTTTDVINLNVRTSPLVNIAGTNTVCSNANVTLTGTGVNTFTWMPGAMHTPMINATAPSSTVYTLTGNLGSCVGTTTFSLTSLPAPNVSIIPDTGCYYHPHVIKAIGAPNYTWSTGSLYDTTIVTHGTNNSYTVTGFDGTCYAAASTVVLYSYWSTASLSNINYCQGATINTISLYSNPTGSSFYWFNNNSAIGIPAHGFGKVLPAPNSAIPQTATITGVPDNYGCKGDTAYFIITINPSATIAPVPSQALCSGSVFSGITFSVNPPGASVNWTNYNSHIGLATGNNTGNIAPYTVPTLTTGQLVSVNYNAVIGPCWSPTQTFTLDVETNCVWPGDADENLVVNNTDLFSIGIKYGKSGVARVSQGNNWQGVPCWGWNDWQSTGYNTYFADCDGNGTVDMNDTLAINLNYSLTHPARTGAPGIVQANNPDIYLQFDKTQYLSGDTVKADVYIGSSTNIESNFYGAGFSINYDNSKVQTGTEKFLFNNSWVGNINQTKIKFSKINTGTGVVDVSLVRITHTDTTGFGKIARLQFVLKTGLSNSQMYFTISNSIKTNAIGSLSNLNSGTDSTTVVGGTTGIQSAIGSKQLVVYPNPATNNITIQSSTELGAITIYNSLGEIVLQKTATPLLISPQGEKVTTIDISKLPSGVYTIQAQKKYLKLVKE